MYNVELNQTCHACCQLVFLHVAVIVKNIFTIFNFLLSETCMFECSVYQLPSSFVLLQHDIFCYINLLLKYCSLRTVKSQRYWSVDRGHRPHQSKKRNTSVTSVIPSGTTTVPRLAILQHPTSTKPPNKVSSE